jgi:hypothetical protein
MSTAANVQPQRITLRQASTAYPGDTAAEVSIEHLLSFEIGPLIERLFDHWGLSGSWRLGPVVLYPVHFLEVEIEDLNCSL